ncbi:MAG: caspase domain-containing protein [Leptothrix sp. (in: b-proteobacteria)]
MATKAVFIGVNKHVDASIPELSGACRDAIALWALFTDTLTDLSAHLLIDEQATHATASAALNATLAGAAEGDVVIISFAGHGSADGSLVFHDTQAANLGATALSMAVLADAFKSTKARAVLCLLDCCFSGHAPARVLETNAMPRNAFALTGVYGEGRILISACTSTEAAWEQPGTGHGLLTYAVIEAMTRESTDTISFPAIADDIISLARYKDFPTSQYPVKTVF